MRSFHTVNIPAAAGERSRGCPAFIVVRRSHGRWREVRDSQGDLACVTVYERGAVEVVRRLAA